LEDQTTGPTDDPTIADSEMLWRRVVPSPDWIVLEGDTYRVSSLAFFSSDGEISVHLASLTSVSSILSRYPRYSVARIEARHFRACGHTISRDPTPEDPSHLRVLAPPGRGVKDLRRDARTIAAKADWEFLNTEAIPSHG
jgi:hypothetical protein